MAILQQHRTWGKLAAVFDLLQRGVVHREWLSTNTTPCS
jgi:hypothetical protein